MVVVVVVPEVLVVLATFVFIVELIIPLFPTVTLVAALTVCSNAPLFTTFSVVLAVCFPAVVNGA